ncbi:MAG: class I SAM-dependent methyltransferase, partial [Candidatus Omnitrophota bacterium]|nr:class I SAM-dependent methyltransferase [Candidatus Omnitrophota bacterium]
MEDDFLKENEKGKYTSCWGTGRYVQSEQSFWITEIIKSLNPKSKVLDLGCGNGFVVKRLVDNGIDAYGVDITSAGWMKKSEVNPAFKVLQDRLHEAPLWEIPFADKEFDMTFSTTVLEHIPTEKVDLTIKEILRVTKRKTIHYVDTVKEQEQFGENLHMTVQPCDWWLKKFAENNTDNVECIVRDKHELTASSFKH